MCIEESGNSLEHYEHELYAQIYENSLDLFTILMNEMLYAQVALRAWDKGYNLGCKRSKQDCRGNDRLQIQ